MAKSRNEDVSLDMTPMIDVVFQLIIFFVVTLKMTDDKDTSIKLADGRNGIVLTQDELPPSQLTIDVASSGRISMSNITMSDAMIVIGGRESANSRKLFALASQLCPRTYFIETAAELDTLLARYGYTRRGDIYTTDDNSDSTVCLVCHFGIECVLIGHLIGVSPMPLWHGFVAAPTGITSLHTEERVKGIAAFRINEFGATPHLMIGGVEPSKRARFIECYGDSVDGFEPDSRKDRKDLTDEGK